MLNPIKMLTAQTSMITWIRKQLVYRKSIPMLLNEDDLLSTRVLFSEMFDT